MPRCQHRSLTHGPPQTATQHSQTTSISPTSGSPNAPRRGPVRPAGTSSARWTTSPRNRSAEVRWTPVPTSTRWVACSTTASLVILHSSGTTWRPCFGRTWPSVRRRSLAADQTFPLAWTLWWPRPWPRHPRIGMRPAVRWRPTSGPRSSPGLRSNPGLRSHLGSGHPRPPRPPPPPRPPRPPAPTRAKRAPAAAAITRAARGSRA